MTQAQIKALIYTPKNGNLGAIGQALNAAKKSTTGSSKSV